MNLLTKLLIIVVPILHLGCSNPTTYEMERMSEDVLEQKGTAKDGISITILPIPPPVIK